MVARIIPTLVLIALQAYLLRRFWKWSHGRTAWVARVRIPVVVLFGFFNAALLAVAVLQLRGTAFPDWFVYSAIYPFYWWHAASFVVAFALLVASLLKLPFRALWGGLKRIPATKAGVASLTAHPSVQRFDQSRRVFLRRSVYGLTAVSFGGMAYGMVVGKHECEVTASTIRVPGLPPEFSGYSIGLVSDVHSSMYMRKKEMLEYVRMLNAMDVDMIVVAGDIVNALPEEVFPYAEAFCGLRARDGAFGVLGNHDFYSREPDQVAEISTQAGVRILRDEGVLIRRGGSSLRLLGIDDAGSAPAALRRLDTALARVTGPGPTILMCHRPYFLKELSGRGIDVVLSGHTHGGQIVFGTFADTTFTPAAIASPYVWGPYREGNTRMYVSRGIGTVGIPVRLNCPPELTRIVLQPA